MAQEQVFRAHLQMENGGEWYGRVTVPLVPVGARLGRGITPKIAMRAAAAQAAAQWASRKGMGAAKHISVMEEVDEFDFDVRA